MLSLKRLFNKSWDNANKTIVLTLFGIKIKIRKKYSLQTMNEQIKTLSYLLNYCVDITNIKPAQGKLREIQLSCIEILDYVDNICKMNNFCYWIDAGTLIGSIRHQGFIPWDDDIDLCMPRQDYNKILEYLTNNSSEYNIRLKAKRDHNFQIRITNTKTDAALDIFPVDNYYETDLDNNKKKELTKLIRYARKIFDDKFPPEEANERRITFLKSELLKIQNDMILDNKNINIQKPSLFYGIDFPYESNNYLIYNYDEIYPLQNKMFEGKLYPVPNLYDYYLRNLYDNYMQFPNVIPNIDVLNK